jgi:hypothetical protein
LGNTPLKDRTGSSNDLGVGPGTNAKTKQKINPGELFAESIDVTLVTDKTR